MAKNQFKLQLHQVLSPLFAFGIFCLSVNVQAETIEDGRYWLNLSLAGALPAEDWRWTLDLRPRWREEGRDFDQFIASGFAIKQFNPQLSLGLGVDHVVNHPASRESFEENRISTQMAYKFDAIGRIKLQSRTRFELRRREQFDDTAYRLREMLRATLPITDSNFSLVVWDELMLNLNNADWNVARGIDQNRIFLGLNYKLNAHAAIETGYLNQYLNTRTIDRENHIINTTFSYQF